MPFIQLVIALVVLGILYLRMIKRESPGPIAKAQAIVPIVLGAASTGVSFLLFLGVGSALDKAGFSSKSLPSFIRSVIAAFVMAGFPEEITKLVMILVTLLIFRKRIRNVYEYILIGAAVGFGFTLLEEFLYGSGSVVTAVMRLTTIASHMAFGIIMAKHLGTARYNKEKGSGSVAGEYVLAFFVPMLLHTLYDAGTATNVYLNSGNEDDQAIGMAIALASTVALFVIQIVVLVRLKKNTQKYCGMVLKGADRKD